MAPPHPHPKDWCNPTASLLGLFFMHCYVKCLFFWILWRSTEFLLFLLFTEKMLSNTFLASANKLSQNYGICQDIPKKQHPRGPPTKNQHCGANRPWEMGPAMLRWLRTNPSKFDLGLNVQTQVKFRRTCTESPEHKWANTSGTICPEIPIPSKQAS